MSDQQLVEFDHQQGDGKIVFLGTQHNSEQSLQDVREYFRDNSPDRICVEASEKGLQSREGGLIKSLFHLGEDG